MIICTVSGFNNHLGRESKNPLSDPIFTVSGPVDHYKAAIMAKMSAAKFVSAYQMIR